MNVLLVFFIRVPYMQISDINPGVNIIGGKVSIASVNRAGWPGGVLRPHWGFRGWSGLKKISGSKEQLDWLKVDFSVTKVITVQDYNNNKMWMEVHIYNVKAKSHLGNICVKHIMTT